MTDELKPCAHCGHPARLCSQDGERGMWWVQCDRCTINTELSDSKDECIKIWNTRSDPEDMPAWMVGRIQDLRKFILGSKYGDWKYSRVSDSEQFNILKAEIDKYLGYVLSFKKGDE